MITRRALLGNAVESLKISWIPKTAARVTHPGSMQLSQTPTLLQVSLLKFRAHMYILTVCSITTDYQTSLLKSGGFRTHILTAASIITDYPFASSLLKSAGFPQRAPRGATGTVTWPACLAKECLPQSHNSVMGNCGPIIRVGSTSGGFSFTVGSTGRYTTMELPLIKRIKATIPGRLIYQDVRTPNMIIGLTPVWSYVVALAIQLWCSYPPIISVQCSHVFLLP